MQPFRVVVITLLAVVLVAALCMSLLIRRSFRATTSPTAFESVVARSIRDAAIPGQEHRAKNPLSQDPQALAQGREEFLAQCAGCHGTDGSGHTPMGENLYPRAPDLRSSSTQSLTDGEIHYIIQYGVQLTGMPAWGNAHQQPAVDSWKLVTFLRSLRPLSREEQSRQTASLSTAHYVGSPACQKCHAEIYARWLKTPMANVVRDPRTHPEAILPNLASNTVSGFTLDQVALVYGQLWKQRYFTKIGDDYFPLSAQWVVGQRAWRPYLVPQNADWWAAYYPPDNLKRPTGPTCDGCHSVNYDIHTKQVTEWNVGCERCHGPGSEHVAHATRGNIFNPAHMDSVAANDTCVQCHSQGRPLSSPIEGNYYDWPVGYRVGLRLADYWKLEDCTLGQADFYYFPDCTAHKNRMQGNDFAQSVMYRRGVTCGDCHDVHGTSNYAQLRKPAEQICLDCHGPASPNGPHTATLEEHTHHKSGSTGSQCVACHMPQIQSEGVPGAFVHAHTFRFISPEMTDRYKIPNPCNSCHKDKSTTWAEDALRHWPEVSPWRLKMED